MVETIECPHCHKSHVVKVWFPDGYVWASDVTTDPYNNDYKCSMYVCPQCGKVSLLSAQSVKDMKQYTGKCRIYNEACGEDYEEKDAATWLRGIIEEYKAHHLQSCCDMAEMFGIDCTHISCRRCMIKIMSTIADRVEQTEKAVSE